MEGSKGTQVLETTVTYDFAIVASSTQNKLIASHLGFETYSHLLINSDLVNNLQYIYKKERMVKGVRDAMGAGRAPAAAHRGGCHGEWSLGRTGNFRAKEF